MGNKGEVGHPSDVTDEEWEFALPYLLLSREDSAYREHDLRTVFNGVRSIARTGNQWRFIPHDYPPWPAIISRCSAGCGPDVSSGWLKTPASCGASLLGARASRPQSALIAGRSSPRPRAEPAPDTTERNGARDRRFTSRSTRWDTCWRCASLLPIRATAPRSRPWPRICRPLPEARSRWPLSIRATPDRTPQKRAQNHGIRLEGVKHPLARRGFVLLPRRWVVERSFAWTARFRRLARDYQRLDTTLKGFHYIAFPCLMIASIFKQLA